jgi:hypothetical protein
VVHLKDFSLVSPEIQSSDVLKAIEMAIPATAIEMAIANTQSQEERKRSLPSQLVVCLVIAISFWSRDSMRDVLKNLHVRAQKPREVVQEVYGWLLGHWSVRVLMFQSATTAGVPPLRLSFTGTLRVIRRVFFNQINYNIFDKKAKKSLKLTFAIRSN